MPYADLRDFLGALKLRQGMGSLALEFLIYTAARSGEVRGAAWSEIDLGAKVWSIPGARMKAGNEHRVPLTDRCLAILAEVRPLNQDGAGDRLVFPGARWGMQLSDMSLSAVLRRMALGQYTVHGFRSAFSDWVGEETNFPRELAEESLAHLVGNAVSRAYRRGDALEKRRELMNAWARYLEGPAGANVVPIRSAQSAVGLAVMGKVKGVPKRVAGKVPTTKKSKTQASNLTIGEIEAEANRRAAEIKANDRALAELRTKVDRRSRLLADLTESEKRWHQPNRRHGDGTELARTAMVVWANVDGAEPDRHLISLRKQVQQRTELIEMLASADVLLERLPDDGRQAALLALGALLDYADVPSTAGAHLRLVLHDLIDGASNKFWSKAPKHAKAHPRISARRRFEGQLAGLMEVMNWVIGGNPDLVANPRTGAALGDDEDAVCIRDQASTAAERMGVDWSEKTTAKSLHFKVSNFPGWPQILRHGGGVLPVRHSRASQTSAISMRRRCSVPSNACGFLMLFWLESKP